MGRRNTNTNRQSSQSQSKTSTKNQRNLASVQKQLSEHVDKLLRISTIPQQQNVIKALENQCEISAIIDRIKALEADKNLNNATLPGDRTSGATVDRFVSWASENGAEFKNCTIKNFDGYDLGLQAACDIPKSSLIVAVPRPMMLTIEAANQSALGKLIANDQILKNMPNVTLSIFLLYEKFKESSFWKPYIDILPTTYTTVLYFSIDELEELKGSPTLEIALRQIKSIARQYAYFYKLFYASNDPVCKQFRERFTYSEYCWAVSTVMTRQNTVPFVENDSQRTNALIPLWDLCNHTNGTITTGYNPVRDRSECLALRDFKAGEQLFIFYGARSNADLFIHNGFVFEANEYDTYWIRLGISKSDSLRDKRIELLGKLTIPSTNDFCIKSSMQPIDGQLLAFLRIFNMNEEQLEHWLKSDKFGDLQYIDCALDTALEKKSWHFLQARLQLLLASSKTTLEDDVKLVKNREISPNRLLAIRMRTTEKRIIKDTIEYVEQCIKQ